MANVKIKIALAVTTVLLLLGEVCNAYTFVAIAKERCSRHRRDTRQQNGVKGPDMKSLKVDSIIKYRFANTIISSKIANRANISQEVSFSTILPETAFISGFAIGMNGKVYKAYVREKEEARREYQAAVSSGRTAGHVELSTRDSNSFTVSVNVEAHAKVTFNLTYEELLVRELDMYKQKINLKPGQLVKDLRVTVHIEEGSSITKLEVPQLQVTNEISVDDTYQQNPLVNITRPSSSSAVIQWLPTMDQQRELNNDGVEGLFEVRYDVDRVAQPNQILINEGYFVHFFAPPDIPPMHKHVVFVLDRSGSMFGHKIDQLKQSMTTILDELNQGDIFSIVTFSSDVTIWNSDQGMIDVELGEPLSQKMIVSVTPDNIQEAKSIVNSIDATGGTHIHLALQKGLEIVQLGSNTPANTLSEGQEQNQNYEPMIIFLTDGEPNGPNSDLGTIINDTTSNNQDPPAVLYSLAFGRGADFNFLKKLSLRNQGFARKIYEASDAALQLRDFYRKVSSPLLANVSFHYTNEQVDPSSLTKTSFATHLKGSEIAVAGRVVGTNEVAGNISGFGLNGDVMICSMPSVVVIDYYPRPPVIQNASSAGFMERLWAYLTIQQLLDLKEKEDNETITEKAKELALKYSFVTPLTSLVVIKPDDNDTATNPEEPSQSSRGHLVTAGMWQPDSTRHYLQHAPGVPRMAMAYMPMIPRSFPPQYASRSNVGVGSLYSSRRDSRRGYGESLTVTDSLTHIAPGTANSESHPIATTTPPAPCINATAPTYLTLSNYTWFPFFSNATHLTILISDVQETLELGYNEPDVPHSSCVSQLNSTAHCRHLPHCTLEAFAENINTYIQNFCRIGNFAGVCCPDQPAGC